MPYRVEDSELSNTGRAYSGQYLFRRELQGFFRGGGVPEPSSRARLDSFSVAPDGGDIFSLRLNEGCLG